jgi:hypothetical protein
LASMAMADKALRSFLLMVCVATTNCVWHRLRLEIE